MKKSTWIFLLLNCCGVATLHAQTAKFNLSQASHTVSGWTNVAGDPSVSVLTSTSNGITLSTVRAHLHTVYEKLHVSSRTEAVVKFLAQE